MTDMLSQVTIAGNVFELGDFAVVDDNIAVVYQIEPNRFGFDTMHVTFARIINGFSSKRQITVNADGTVALKVPVRPFQPYDEEVAALARHMARGAIQQEGYARDNRERAVAAERDLETFKETVKTKALELAEEHGWCEVVTEALESWGISTEVEVEVTFTGTMTMTVPWHDRNDVGTDDVYDAIQNGTDFNIIVSDTDSNY